MCKCILDVIQSLHKQLFKQKPRAISSGNVSEAIFDQICYVLPTLHEKNIFRATSFEHLGKLYFDNIHTSVDGATDDNIQEVIRKISASDSEFAQQRDYWLALVDLAHIKALPRDVYAKVKKEYNAVYWPKYQNVKKKYNANASLHPRVSQLL